MTVAEFIKTLQELPQRDPVFLGYPDPKGHDTRLTPDFFVDHIGTIEFRTTKKSARGKYIRLVVLTVKPPVDAAKPAPRNRSRP